ncbi:MAG: MBL fold metallo-hydrolase [Candidatus Hodarchaeota archaeon]
MNLSEVTDSVIVCQDPSYYQVNMVCVDLDSEMVFVDTCTKTKLANSFRKQMEKKFGGKKATLVITHANADHFQGIDAFKDLPVVVSDPFLERIKQYRLSAKPNKLLQQALTFSKEITFGSEKHPLLFRYCGGHTDDSIYGFLPSEKVIIAGDNLLSNMPQYFPFVDTDLDKWITCLQSWEQMNADKFICGHGGIVGKNHVTKVREFFEKLREYLDKSLKENFSLKEALNHPDMPTYFENDPEKWIKQGIRQQLENLI